MLGALIRDVEALGRTEQARDQHCAAQCDAEPTCEFWVRETAAGGGAPAFSPTGAAAPGISLQAADGGYTFLKKYTVASVGTTNFMAVGAPANVAGATFVATTNSGALAGTGEAFEATVHRCSLKKGFITYAVSAAHRAGYRRAAGGAFTAAWPAGVPTASCQEAAAVSVHADALLCQGVTGADLAAKDACEAHLTTSPDDLATTKVRRGACPTKGDARLGPPAGRA
jgi:hypothetical protein